MFLLDTNVISDLRRPDKAPASLLAWSRSVSAHTLFISCITLFELELGVRQRERRETFNISLVGYTNAGKSTLFNALVKARAYAADQLFDEVVSDYNDRASRIMRTVDEESQSYLKSCAERSRQELYRIATNDDAPQV